MNEYLRDFSSLQYTTVGFLGCIGATELQRMVLSRIDRLGAARLVPQSWRYIMVGIARK